MSSLEELRNLVNELAKGQKELTDLVKGKKRPQKKKNNNNKPNKKQDPPLKQQQPETTRKTRKRKPRKGVPDPDKCLIDTVTRWRGFEAKIHSYDPIRGGLFGDNSGGYDLTLRFEPKPEPEEAPGTSTKV